jgi:hypothetical protein
MIDSGSGPIEVKLERWIDPAKWGWYSGDTHIHAGGCAHYQVPTEGVSPETMIRHVRGEGLSIADVLSWAPSWYYQKQFFTGHSESPAASLEHPDLQAANNASLMPRATQEDKESLLRYDVEVSGFPSSHAGHLVLLRLSEEDYPGTKVIEDWPSWNLPILKWARGQGALAGYAHCGNGMVVDSTDLPNYEIPPMDGIGTQEAIIDVTHGAVDFLSGCDTRPVAELNAWYHMLNCGYRLAMIGETDFPCITGDRPGVGRSYVHLAERPEGDAGYEAWIKGLRDGRLYCGDGRSHFLDFRVQGKRSGEGDVALAAAGRVKVEATVAARLEPEATVAEAERNAPSRVWHLENARIGNTRTVPVELIVNGVPVATAALLADGTPQPGKLVVGWVFVEEAVGLEQKADVGRGHHRIILRPRKVGVAEGVPEDDVGVLDGPVGCGPGGGRRRRCSGWDNRRRRAFSSLVGRDPDVVVDEAGALAPPGVLEASGKALSPGKNL